MTLNLKQNWLLYFAVIFILVFIYLNKHNSLKEGDIIFINSEAHKITLIIEEDYVTYFHTRKIW